jgi:hypothetical protein
MILDEKMMEFTFVVIPSKEQTILHYYSYLRHLISDKEVIDLCHKTLEEAYGKRLFKVTTIERLFEEKQIKICPRLYYVLSVTEDTFGISQLSSTWKTVTYVHLPEEEISTSNDYLMEAVYVGRDENNWLIYKGGMNNVSKKQRNRIKIEDHLPNM